MLVPVKSIIITEIPEAASMLKWRLKIKPDKLNELD